MVVPTGQPHGVTPESLAAAGFDLAPRRALGRAAAERQRG